MTCQSCNDSTKYIPIHAFCGGVFIETGTCDIMSGEVSTYKCEKCGYETDDSDYERFQRHWDNKLKRGGLVDEV